MVIKLYCGYKYLLLIMNTFSFWKHSFYAMESLLLLSSLLLTAAIFGHVNTSKMQE